MIKRRVADGRVAATGAVTIERLDTNGYVGVTSGIANERKITVSGVAVSVVARQGIATGGRVLEAGGEAKKRVFTDGSIAGAGGEAKEGISALSGVVAGIASVRGWRNRARRRQKRKRGEGECDEKATVVQSRGPD